MAGIATEARDQGALLLRRHDFVRPGQEARAAGSSIAVDEVDIFRAQAPQFRQTRAIASGSSALDRAEILSR